MTTAGMERAMAEKLGRIRNGDDGSVFCGDCAFSVDGR